MRLEPPEKVTREQITLDVREIEPLLQAPAMDLKPWPTATIQLKDGRTMLIREAKLEEAPMMMEYIKKVMEADHDFYDVVGARVYAELIGWYRKRLKDPYVLVGLIDGVWAGFANGRLLNEDINISLHTMALMRGLRVGAIMYYAKAYYGFEILGNKEWWATYESYNGWWRWGVGMAQPSYPWPDYQHELGGARVYYITKKYWDHVVKDYVRQMVGAELNFDVPDEVLKANEVMRVPDEVLV
ncbi:MAG: N-acetyltransferase [Chloroflexi bacterium]|nr:MAG: N-acetyltransferase [Chloroflexota bacterium]